VENQNTIDNLDGKLDNQNTSQGEVYSENNFQNNPNVEDGQIKCPKCGSTDISFNQNTGRLRCNFCRHEFEGELVNEIEDLHNLEGEQVDYGAQDIIPDTTDILTLKCASCGAEVVIDTNEALQARCHWCRNILSINNQIPNGAIPDMILPFGLSKEEAKIDIENFVEKRQFFAHPQFKCEFTTENIMGVYFPYMIIDVNLHTQLFGEGEHLVRTYRVGRDNDYRVYDADLYELGREFDLFIDDLTIESSSQRLKNSNSKTNNIINSIMPFDTENCVKWNPNYLKGFSSEKRDTNVEDLKEIVSTQIYDIGRFKANETLGFYDRGVKWIVQNFDIKGLKWESAYLPVWLYSYQQIKGNGESILHYVAINARTRETMGSIPIYMSKLVIVSAVIEIVLRLLSLILYSFVEHIIVF